MENFPCTSCGSCCRRVGLTNLFPKEWVKADNSCINLSFDNKCLIYDTRPNICRIQDGTHLGIDKLTYWKYNAEICNIWMKEDLITDKFIDLTIFNKPQTTGDSIGSD